MNAAGASQPLSEADLVVVGRWLARAFLEIERGQRSPWTLERFVTPLVVRILDRIPQSACTRPLGPFDVGGVAVSARPSCAYVTVGISGPGGTRDALLIELRRVDHGWTVVDLGRLSWRCDMRSPARVPLEPMAVAS